MNDHVIRNWRNLTHAGLAADQRETLLKKYAPSETVVFLKTSLLNPECKSALKSNSIVKRNNFNTKG